MPKKSAVSISIILKKLSVIAEYFESGHEIDVEESMRKLKEGAELIKEGKKRLKETENSFKEIEKNLKD